MGRGLKYLFRLVLLGVLAFLGYAIFGDPAPRQTEVTVEIPVPAQN